MTEREDFSVAQSGGTYAAHYKDENWICLEPILWDMDKRIGASKEDMPYGDWDRFFTDEWEKVSDIEIDDDDFAKLRPICVLSRTKAHRILYGVTEGGVLVLDGCNGHPCEYHVATFADLADKHC